MASRNQREDDPVLSRLTRCHPSKAPISTERFNSERQILNNFFNYLIKEKVFKENPVTGIEKKKIVRNKKPKSLSRANEAILDAWLRGEREDQTNEARS